MKITWWLAATILLIIGCKEDLGIELPPDIQRTEVKYIEFTLPVSNVYFDSLRSDNQGQIFVGEYSDNIYGSIKTSGNTEFRYKSGLFPDDSVWIRKNKRSDLITNIEFLSASLNLDVNGAITNDNILSQHLEIYSLLDSIYGSVLYLGNRVIQQGDLIGEGDIALANPSSLNFDNDTLYYPMSVNLTSSYGMDLFNLFSEKKQNIRPLGFLIKSTSANGIFSFDLNSDTTELLLNMKGVLRDTATLAAKDTLFTTAFRLSSTNHFTHVDRNRVGSSFSSVSNGQEVDISSSHVYFNALAGIHPKIDLTPYLDFSELEMGVLIHQATLTIEPEKNTANIPVIPATQYYFSRKSNDQVTVNWPGSQFPASSLRTLLQADEAYFTFKPLVATHLYDSILVRYNGNPTLFTQILYDNIQDDMNGVDLDDRPLVQEMLLDVDNLLMVSAGRLPLGRISIPKEGVKLKIFYSKLR